MILVDTSAWIEFLRDTGSAVCKRTDTLIAGRIATCDAIRMELLAGARDEDHLQALRRLLARATTLPTSPAEYETAAALYRTCRRKSETVRKLIDCLIAAVAIRHGVALLHADADFDALARHPIQLDERAGQTGARPKGPRSNGSRTNGTKGPSGLGRRG